jgi:hypothetical protein
MLHLSRGISNNNSMSDRLGVSLVSAVEIDRDFCLTHALVGTMIAFFLDHLVIQLNTAPN